MFICSWMPVLGRLFFSFPAMVALEESQEGTAALVCTALSLFPSGGGFVPSYLPPSKGSLLHNGNLTVCICFVLV